MYCPTYKIHAIKCPTNKNDLKSISCATVYDVCRCERDSLLQGSGVCEAVERDLTNMQVEFNNNVRPFVSKHQHKFR